jgi:hypothetical protein
MCPNVLDTMARKDVFLDDMGLGNSVEMALANLDLHEPMLDLITFDDGDPPEGSSSTPTDANFGLDIEEDEDENGGKSSSRNGDFDDSDMEEDYKQ